MDEISGRLNPAWRPKSARDISLNMFLIFSLGELLWFVCGLLIHSATGDRGQRRHAREDGHYSGAELRYNRT